MTRKSRLFIQGLPHLIQLRGHNYTALFNEDTDYHQFLHALDQVIQQHKIDLYAYALMPERILLFLEAPDKPSLSGAMQAIGRRYVRYYNQRYQRRGTLWESRYCSCPVEPDAYFLLVKKFVECLAGHAAPYKSLADSPAERIRQHERYLRLGDDADQRRRGYQQFCNSYESPTLTERIQAALEQNCLLATPGYSQALEQTLHRHLRPRHAGRPRKHYPNPVEAWAWIEQQAERLLQRYCYREIRMPLLERWEQELTARSFSAQSRHVSLHHQALLRGDGTMGCLRLIAQHQHLQTTSKLWYQGAMFRRSRQHGEPIQQFYQLGVEAFGFAGIGIELEHISLQYAFFQTLDLASCVELKINTSGSMAEFSQFREALRDYYTPLVHILPAEQRQWLDERPERLLNHPDPLLRRLASTALTLPHFLSAASRARFNRLCDALDALRIPFTCDENLFPVNDYCHLLLEWHSDHLPDNTLLCRGGRYDESASYLVGKPIHACGFAFMLEPIMQLLRQVKSAVTHDKQVDIAILPVQARAHGRALLLGQWLREKFPQFSIFSDFSVLRLATRQRNARQRGARFILLVDDNDTRVLCCDQETHQTRALPATELARQLSAALLL